jgi:hypothetical protein
VVELASVDGDLDDEDRARLHIALDAADDELRAGNGIPGEKLLAPSEEWSEAERRVEAERGSG